MHPPILTIAQFRDRLQESLEKEPSGAVVFDADGTLWKHDVGVMTFTWAIERRLLRPEAAEPLAAFAQSHGVPLNGTQAHEIAAALQAAFAARRLPERAAAEMQVWAYVGYSEPEFRALVQDALEKKGHLLTLHHDVLGLAEWVRSQAAPALIVSASPQWVVEEATAGLGFARGDVIAGLPELEPDAAGTPRIVPRLSGVLPYGPDKVDAGRRLMGSRPWLAALGDSSFDVDMFRAARLAGGVGEKPGMLAGLAELTHGVRLLLQD